VFYGGTEFSRDTDLAIVADSENLARLTTALSELQAEVAAVPPFELRYLERGLAIHFHCNRPDVSRMRVDVMSVMRGVDPFPALWERRTTLEMTDGQLVNLLSISDLVKAKKTQREKDWPMITAVVEAHYECYREQATDDHVRFWLRESRTPEILIHIAAEYPELAIEIARKRDLVNLAISGDNDTLRSALSAERLAEEEADRHYWQPLKAELESIRLTRPREK
jgi:hypothetical protein